MNCFAIKLSTDKSDKKYTLFVVRFTHFVCRKIYKFSLKQKKKKKTKFMHCIEKKSIKSCLMNLLRVLESLRAPAQTLSAPLLLRFSRSLSPALLFSFSFFFMLPEFGHLQL